MWQMREQSGIRDSDIHVHLTDQAHLNKMTRKLKILLGDGSFPLWSY